MTMVGPLLDVDRISDLGLVLTVEAEDGPSGPASVPFVMGSIVHFNGTYWELHGGNGVAADDALVAALETEEPWPARVVSPTIISGSPISEDHPLSRRARPETWGPLRHVYHSGPAGLRPTLGNDCVRVGPVGTEQDGVSWAAVLCAPNVQRVGVERGSLTRLADVSL